MKKRWIYRDIPDRDLIHNLAQSINVVGSLATLLIQRGVKDFDAAKTFFRPSLENLHDPFLMLNMAQTMDVLDAYVGTDKKILIYGDYDVDGTTAVSLLYSFLRKLHQNLDFYLPDRHKEGYGVSQKAIEWAYQEGFELIISLDCGIRAIDAIQNARDKGIDFIVCDHHLPGEKLPPATAILNPKQSNCNYPFKELTGCGIAFKLIQAFCQHFSVDIIEAWNLLDLVAVSIALDMVPIIGENRTLAFFGLQKLNEKACPGLQALIDIAGLKNKISLSIGDLVFKLGPRINAVGRLRHASKAVEMLISDDEKQTSALSIELNRLNQERKHLDHTCTQEALEMLKSKGESATTVLYNPDWHQGIIGIVAARCIEQYHRPTIILTASDEDGVLVGSARSVPGFNLYEAINQCGDLLTRYGGHKQAAGLSVSLDKLEIFRQKFEEVVQNTIQKEELIAPLNIDLKIDLDAITPKFYNIIQQMAPFGPENMRPVFVSEALVCTQIRLLKDKHVRFYVRQKEGKRLFPVIGFNMADYYEGLINANLLNLCYVIEQNEYQGKQSLQLQARDIQF